MTGIHYLKEKRGKKDYCNICGQLTDLTWDHIPPNGVTHGESVIANTVFEKLPAPTEHMKRFQSGIKYRPLCSRCNNEVLGENDKIYQQFFSDVERQLSSPVWLNKIVVPVKIIRLCRAMIGHALAAKNSFDAEVIPDQQMRRYVLDQSMKLSEIKLYTWLYPYKTIIIARDFVTRGFQKNTHPSEMVSAVIASYPLAYMITDESTSCGLDDLGRYTTTNIEDEVENTAAIDKDLQKCGYYILVTSDKMTAPEAIKAYSKRDCVEKVFLALKSFLGMNKIGVQTDEAIHAKSLIWFVASILHSLLFIKTQNLRAMDRKTYTVPAIIDQLEEITGDKNLSSGKYERRYKPNRKQSSILYNLDISTEEIDDQISKLKKVKN